MALVGGEVVYKTTLDTSGYQKGVNDITNKTKSGGSTVKSIVAGLGITKLISKAFDVIRDSMDGAISRLDTMNNFPKVMENLGIGAKESEKAIKKLSDGLQGIPTTLDAGALAVQRFTSKNGDVQKSADLFLAVNDAILAGGASSQIQESALEQLSQAYAKGKMDMMEWRTLQMAMPAQLKQVATAMGLTTDELGEMLRTGDNTEQVFDDFLNTIMRMDKEGVKGFKSLKEQARNATGGIQTSITNMKTAITRGVADMIQQFDKVLKKRGFGGISGAITEIGKKAEGLFKEVSKYLPKIVNFVVDLFKVVKKLLPEILATVAALVAYKATILIIKGINFASSMISAVSAMLSLTQATENADKAMKALNTTTSANPIGGVVAAVTALVAAFQFAYKEVTKGLKELDDELQESKDNVDEFVNSYKEIKKARDESINSSISELTYYENLWHELQNVTDENGNVQKGYEERANFIINTLNEALGTEIKLNGNLIENYQGLTDSIDKYIQKLKAEAIITAQKDVYADAIAKRADAIKQLEKAEAERNKQQAILNELEEKYGNSIGKVSGFVNQEITKQINDQKKRVEESQKSYDEMQNTVDGYYQTISESEAMFTDFSKGEYDKLTNIHYDYQNTMEKDEQKQKDSLLNQIMETEKSLGTLRELKQQHNTNIYDADIKATEDELKAMKDRYAGLIGTTENSEKVVQDKILESMNKQVATIKGKKYEFKDAGDGNVQLYVDGIKQGQPIAEDKASKLSNQVAEKLKDGKITAEQAGEYLLEGVDAGINSKKKQNTVFSSISIFAGGMLSVLKKSLKISSPSKETKKYGEWLLEGFNIGINDEKQEVINNIDNFSNDIVKRMANAVNVQTGKMAFSGTSGTVNQILTATGTTTVINENKLLLDGDVVYENQKKVSARKNLQTQFGGAYNVSN